VLLGRLAEARRLFERLLTLRNDVGLLAEDYDSRWQRLVGKFSTGVLARGAGEYGHNLARATKPAEQRAAS
jgi:hypothetical protein